MAIAVLGIIVVAMMALIPAGMGQFQTAMDATISAQISQRIITDAEQAEFDKLTAQVDNTNQIFYVLPARYFDADGTEIVSTVGGRPTGKDLTRLVYVTRVRGSYPGPADSDAGGDYFTALPGEGGLRPFHPRASSFLTVQVAQNPALRDLPVETATLLWKKNSAPMNMYTAVITRSSYSHTAK